MPNALHQIQNKTTSGNEGDDEKEATVKTPPTNCDNGIFRQEKRKRAYESRARK